jgi:hypothetical protein
MARVGTVEYPVLMVLSPGFPSLRRSCLAVAAVAAVVGMLAAPLGCASGPQTRVSERAKILRDQRITRAQLEEMSNAFADRYFTLMLGASERVMRGNKDVQQCRIMNGLRLLGVSSMYDISTSPDTLTQLVDQLVVVTLECYFWVDSGRSQKIWGERAQPVVEALRRAREDAWALASKVFTDDQLEDLDLTIATWWSRNGGTDFVAYVRFSEVASTKGESLIERVRSGQGLLEPIDRATEQAEEARFALERSFFWTKRVPLFANWLVMALMYDILAVPDLQRVVTSLEVISHTAATMPDRVNMVSERVGSVEQTATVLVDRVFRNVLILLITVFLGIYGVILLRRRKAS